MINWNHGFKNGFLEYNNLKNKLKKEEEEITTIMAISTVNIYAPLH
jgi:hypothetical protein